MGRIFSTGVAPSLGFGACVNGVTDGELKAARQILFAATPPVTPGTSLTAKLALLGDPAASLAIAPAVQWHRHVWRALCGLPGPKEPLTFWRRLWEDATQRLPKTWRGCRGPIAAAVLSLQRIGWRALDGFRWVDDRGQELALTGYSPRLLGMMLREGVQRQLERNLAVKAGLAPEGNPEGVRAMVDVARSLLRSKKVDALGKGIIRSFFCGSIWTTERARENGYNIEVKCALCGCCDDSVAHRLRCMHPSAVAARAQVKVSARARRDFMDGHGEDPSVAKLKWCRGLVQHPCSWYPAPAAESGCFAESRWERRWTRLSSLCRRATSSGMARRTPA